MEMRLGAAGISSKSENAQGVILPRMQGEESREIEAVTPSLRGRKKRVQPFAELSGLGRRLRRRVWVRAVQRLQPVAGAIGGLLMDGPGSVTRWIDDLRAGAPGAARPLWERYFGPMVALARARLRRARSARGGGIEDEEDAALSAFDSFCGGVAQGGFPLLNDRDDLWRLLIVITERKAADQIHRHRRLKRGGGRLVDEATLVAGAGTGRAGFDGLAGPAPEPEFAVAMAEECRRLLDALGDATLCEVAVLKLEGYTSEEIAARLGCAPRTVANKLKLIRLRWTRMGA
jgi:DNA-directed RNA polymerase specialized sigma24 family protein